ncbi:hypothetical protein OFB79_24125, partial [Escherichia coli]|nr:hypothetical protein [Escherichia coli]
KGAVSVLFDIFHQCSSASVSVLVRLFYQPFQISSWISVLTSPQSHLPHLLGFGFQTSAYDDKTLTPAWLQQATTVSVSFSHGSHFLICSLSESRQAHIFLDNRRCLIGTNPSILWASVFFFVISPFTVKGS